MCLCLQAFPDPSLLYDEALRTVPPFVAVHTFCASQDWSEIIGFLKGFACYNTKKFCAAYDYVEKAGPNKGYQNPKRKLGVSKHF